jgi:hypothetical protein
MASSAVVAKLERDYDRLGGEPPTAKLVTRTATMRQLTYRRAIRLGAVAGMVAPMLLAIVFVSLSLRQQSFLESSGWSAVHRTKVEWPSLLELGPQGWLEAAAFVATSLLGIGFAASLFAFRRSRLTAVGSHAITILSLGVGFMAFRPDPPTVVGDRSWHDAIHNGVYPVIPVAALVATAAFAIELWRDAGWRVEARTSATVFLVSAIALTLTQINEIAQLARFFWFGALLAWIAVLANGARRQTTALRDC